MSSLQKPLLPDRGEAANLPGTLKHDSTLHRSQIAIELDKVDIKNPTSHYGSAGSTV